MKNKNKVLIANTAFTVLIVSSSLSLAFFAGLFFTKDEIIVNTLGTGNDRFEHGPQNYFSKNQLSFLYDERTGHRLMQVSDINDKLLTMNIHNTSHSMLPCIDSPNVVLYRNVKPNEILVGDFLIYNATPHYNDTKFILHQVIGRTSDGFVTKGVNNPVKDPYIVKDEEVIGVIVGVLY